MWQSFRAIVRGNSENAWRKKEEKHHEHFISPPVTTYTGGLINRHNSAALQDIFTKFGAEIDTGQLRLPLTSNFTSTKFKMAAAAVLKIHFNGHYSRAIAYIYTKFG